MHAIKGILVVILCAISSILMAQERCSSLDSLYQSWHEDGWTDLSVVEKSLMSISQDSLKDDSSKILFRFLGSCYLYQKQDLGDTCREGFEVFLHDRMDQGIYDYSYLEAAVMLGDCYYAANDMFQAETVYRNGILRCQDILDSCYLGHIIYGKLLNTYIEQGDSAMMSVMHEQIQKSYIKYYSLVHPELAKDSLGLSLSDKYDLLNVSLDISTGVLGDKKKMCEALVSIGNLLMDVENYNEAIYENSLALKFCDNDTRFAILYNIGFCFAMDEEWSSALEYLNKAAEEEKRIIGSIDKNILDLIKLCKKK